MAELSPERCQELIVAIAREPQPRYDAIYHLHQSEAGAEVLQLSPSEQAELTVAMLHWLREPQNWQDYPALRGRRGYESVLSALTALLREPLPLSTTAVLELLAPYCQGEQLAPEADSFAAWSSLPALSLLKRQIAAVGLTPELCHCAETVSQRYQEAGSFRAALELRRLIQSETATIPLLPGEVWRDRAIADLTALPTAIATTWAELLLACAEVTGSKPKAKWLKTNRERIATIGVESFQQAVATWLNLYGKSDGRSQPTSELTDDYYHTDILKGLAWLCSADPSAEVTRALAAATLAAYRKLPGIGPRCTRLGNACVWALGQIASSDSIAQLAKLKVKVKLANAQKGIAKALTASAEQAGIPPAEIEELAVPDYGLTVVGQRRDTLGDFTAELTVTGTSSTALRWLKPDGKPQKSIPKAVKDDYPEALKALKQAAKDIQAMLPAQRDRLETLYLQSKTWDFATWRQRYLDHPLVGTLARRLIWQFSGGDRQASAIWQAGQLVNLQGQPLDWLDDATEVQLWHPIAMSTEAVLAWRNWLLEREIQQPFKQAYREIYLLTAAEQQTRVYSNRFAAHILKHHQFNALCGQRGWKNQLRLMVDDDYPPARKLLPVWGLRAEFWIEGSGDNFDTEATASGSYLYLTTDQVRFYPLEAPDNYAHAGGGGYALGLRAGQEPVQPLALETIPALVFSEVMRDVDLFVGVASIGNDPTWADGGAENRHYHYWQSYSFGELSETAKTRRQVLETLVPRLQIGDRCHCQDRFLVVRGDIRTYKIHLGSGNILMEPNDQYLCIVPDRKQGQGATGQVFLPFEGDPVTSIVLSKAFLLAADTKISDPSIVQQIRA